MEKDLFRYVQYKSYINSWLDDPERGGGFGSRARLSQAIGCQTSYVAQVLKGQAHFSLEQIEAINDFMGHSEQEGLYLLTLVQLERAGTVKLKDRFQKQRDDILESRLNLKNRLGIKQPLNSEAQTVYYSAWYYAVIHVIASQSRFSSAKTIATYLNLDINKVHAVLKFLSDTGLIEKKGAGFKVGKTTIHLPSDSPLIAKHHVNWRLQAMRSLESGKKLDLHYSSINTLSSKDVLRIRELVTKLISEAQTIIRSSPEEEVFCLAMDLFEL